MNKFWLKQKMPHLFIALIIVLLIIPGDLRARSGAKLLIETRDHKRLKGDLLSVDVEEKNLVLNTDGETHKIYMEDIETIRIKRKTNIGKGFLIGAGIGAGVGFISYSDPHGEMLATRQMYVLFFAGVFGILGGLHALSAGKYKKSIQVKGKPPVEIKKILTKLKRKALIRE